MFETVKKTPEQIAKEYQDKKASEAKEQEEKKAEAKGAASDSQSGKEKTEGDIVAEAQAQAKEDERILSSKDEDLSESDRKRKTELVQKREAREKEDKDKKEKEEKSKVQKRIDELTGQIKDLRREKIQDKGKISNLEKELGELKGRFSPNEAELEQKAEVERISKYLKEDEAKERHLRREMSKEELEEWLLEDFPSAQEWLVERGLRRAKEREAYHKNLSDKKKSEEEIKTFTDKLYVEHPELNVEDRVSELLGEGKADKEIHAILCKENPKYKLYTDIIFSDKKYSEGPGGLELALREMNNRLKKQSALENEENKKQADEERIKQEAQRLFDEEMKRREMVDEGINSTTGKKKPEAKKDDFYNKQLEIFKSKGKTKEDLDKILARREKIPGASVYKDSQ